MQKGFSGCLEINNESVGGMAGGYVQKVAEINVTCRGFCQLNIPRLMRPHQRNQ